MERQVGFFDKIGTLIPGYRGYSERESRRNCDKILREGVVQKLIEIEKELNEQMLSLVKLKKFDEVAIIEESRKKINTFSSRVKYAPHGVSAFFTDNQIKEDELMRTSPPYPQTEQDIAFQKKVDLMKNNLDQILVSPFNKNTWGEL
jgi:hypothetical protein